MDLRIVLLGKTGSGKSSTANTILGRNVFREDNSLVSVTQTCENQVGVVDERRISIIDTPGLSDPSMTEERLKSEIKKCMEMSAPGPHVFLLVIRLGVRFTEADVNAVRWIENHFGNDASRYTMILFTHTDQLNGRPLPEYVMESAQLSTVIDSCSCRYHAFSNVNREGRDQVTELIEKIEQMLAQNGEEHYTYETYRNAWSSWISRNGLWVMSTGLVAGLVVFGSYYAFRVRSKRTVMAATTATTIEVAAQSVTRAIRTIGMTIMTGIGMAFIEEDRRDTAVEQQIIRGPIAENAWNAQVNIVMERRNAERRNAHVNIVMAATGASALAAVVGAALAASNGAAGMSIIGAAAGLSVIAAAAVAAAMTAAEAVAQRIFNQ